MFILMIEKQILGSDGKWYVLSATVVPFAPYNGLIISRGEEFEINEVIWDTTLGFFRATTEHYLCVSDESAEDVAANLLETNKWGVMSLEENLTDVRAAHAQQAISELQRTLLARQSRIVKPGGIPYGRR